MFDAPPPLCGLNEDLIFNLKSSFSVIIETSPLFSEIYYCIPQTLKIRGVYQFEL